MRDDGSVILGSMSGNAIRWTEIGGAEVIGQGSLLPAWEGNAMDIADDGTVVRFDIILGNRRAWIQPQGQGDILSLEAWVTDNGGEIPAGVVLEVAQAISADGTVIIGHGFNSAWRIVVDNGPTCAADLVGDGTVNVLDLLELLANWGTAGPGAGLAEPFSVVNVLDMLELLADWGPCPAP